MNIFQPRMLRTIDMCMKKTMVGFDLSSESNDPIPTIAAPRHRLRHPPLLRHRHPALRDQSISNRV
jgi:hypothetical protein